jgi:hypothetical protein
MERVGVFPDRGMGSHVPRACHLLRLSSLQVCCEIIANIYRIGVLDREGNARKVVNCSCVVVKDWGEESQERSILLNYFQTEQ